MEVIADRYELGQTLGAGGMARVVQAHDRVLDRQVAVKLLREDIASDPMVRERFLGEARTAVRFSHPNAVTVYDAGQDGRQPWIAMELISGEDLSQRLATAGRLEETEAVAVADAVLAALEAAHRDGMVHRDVKPGNIMLLDDGGVKLADFGIAKSVQDATAGLTQTGQIIGTAKYLSPEQVDGQPATPASDVYALGCVLYEMLSGQAPFVGDTAIATALAHTRQPVPDVRQVRPDVSPGVAETVQRALAKDPAQRFADAGEMRRALRGESVAAAAYAPTAVLGGVAATQVLPAGAPVADPDRRRRPPWALIALVALALLGALFLISQNDDGTQEAGRKKRRNREQPVKTEQAEEPTRAPQTEAPPEETAAPEQTQAPDPEQIIPRDLPSLSQLLAVQPGAYGEKQEDLRVGIDKVLASEEDKQAEEAAKLQEQTAEWIEKGELNPDIGNLAITLLGPYAEAGGEEVEEDDEKEKGPPPGKGKGKPED